MDYPGSFGDLLAWFPDDKACLDYLEWLRWPDGFTCPRCGPAVAWRYSDGRWFCSSCSRRVSVTAGTIFHGTRTPLSVWFAAAWYMTGEKNGISALGLKRQLGIGSEQTAWAMLHRYRTAMVRPGRDRLTGSIEVDETVLGGPEPGRRGRGALEKTLVEVAVERTGRSFGRCRLQIIEDASTLVLRRFLLDHVEAGSTVVSDGWSSYPSACADDYVHEPFVVSGSGSKAHELLPGVHLIASLAKRWLLGTHQGGVKPPHLQSYLDEFTFRYNRRRSRARGMLFYRLLEQSIAAEPRTYRSLIAGPGSRRKTMPVPPPGKRVHCDSLAGPSLDRPWRRESNPGQPLQH